MLTLVSYDIPDDRRRTKLAQTLKDFGRRVQYSVFECHLEADQVDVLRQKVHRVIDDSADSVRIYRICRDCAAKAEILGIGCFAVDPDMYVL